jgi:hypothetical protein
MPPFSPIAGHTTLPARHGRIASPRNPASSGIPLIRPKASRPNALLAIARATGADTYLSGPSAREYFDEPLFRAAGVTPEWMSYQGYPQYPQLHGDFEHGVTALDLLFNTGPDAPRYLNPSGWEAPPRCGEAAIGLRKASRAAALSWGRSVPLWRAT